MRMTRSVPIVGLGLMFSVLCGCEDGGDMRDTSRYEALEAADGVFGDGSSARHPAEGTVRRSDWVEDEGYHTGVENDRFVGRAPVELSDSFLQRGRERYAIFCTPCHGYDGEGEGMIVNRGYTRPSSFHADRLRQSPDGYLFAVMSRGFGRMPSYAAQVPVEDRWAIVGYIRALQLSRYSRVDEINEAARARLEGGSDG